MIVLGVDPSSDVTGVALVDARKDTLRLGVKVNVQLKRSRFYVEPDAEPDGTLRESFEKCARMADAVIDELDCTMLRAFPPGLVAVEMTARRASSGGGKNNRGLSVAVYGCAVGMVWERVRAWSVARGIPCVPVPVEWWGRARKDARAVWLERTLQGYRVKDDDAKCSIADAAGVAVYAGKRAMLERGVVR